MSAETQAIVEKQMVRRRAVERHCPRLCYTLGNNHFVCQTHCNTRIVTQYTYYGSTAIREAFPDAISEYSPVSASSAMLPFPALEEYTKHQRLE